MEGIKTDSPSARILAEALSDDLFTLIDVGCAGGLDPGWDVFGDKLRALAFDASEAEIARLRREAPRDGTEYIACRVGPPASHALDHEIAGFNWWRRNPWDRLAAGRREKLRSGLPADVATAVAQQWVWPIPDPLTSLPRDLPAAAADPARLPPASRRAAHAADPCDMQMHRTLMSENRWRETGVAPEHQTAHLPDVLADRRIYDIDFVKIDVDGPDYSILNSLDNILDDCGVIGLSVEVNFFGSSAPHHHTFHNTDRYMRSKGFDLYGLTVRNYASAALPRRYVARAPGPTVGGRPIQGDAFYARDTAWKGDGAPTSSFSTPKLIKLAALFALFDLPDQAAEVLLRHRAQLASSLDYEHVLDRLAAEAWPGTTRTYEELIGCFEADDPSMFPPAGD